MSALRAVFKYNFKSDLTGWQHAPRAFAGAKDKGLIICTWPKGGRPGNVMLYSDEVWTGIEYQVAAHMIYEGLVEEGFAIVKGARDRYDGIPRPPIQRNPWNEIECGGHYARAMSSWSLLLALSGWEYDGPRQALRVHAPPHAGELQGLLLRPGRLGQPAPDAGRSGAAERDKRPRRTAGGDGDHTGSDGRAQAGEGGMRRQDDPKHLQLQRGRSGGRLAAAGDGRSGPDAGGPARLKDSPKANPKAGVSDRRQEF